MTSVGGRGLPRTRPWTGPDDLKYFDIFAARPFSAKGLFNRGRNDSISVLVYRSGGPETSPIRHIKYRFDCSPANVMNISDVLNSDSEQIYLTLVQ